MKNYLIFSQLGFLFPKNKKNKIFAISEDVFLNSENYEKNFSRVNVPRHRWLSQKKTHKDWKYLYKLNRIFIKNIHKQLNLIHKTNYSENFWYMFISPWSLPFIQIIFDRWHAINSIINRNKKKFFFTKEINFENNEKLVPLDTEEFLEIFRNDYWNQFIVQGISKNFNRIFYIKSKNRYKIEKHLNKKKSQISFKSIFINLFTNLLKIFNRKKDKYFIYKTYLGMRREFLLCLKLGQMPFFDEIKLNTKKRELNEELRETLIKKIKTKGKFENYLSKIFCSQMPLVFLEKFNELETLIKNHKNLPKKPKKIFSALSLWGNSAVNYYCALKKEENTKIIYAQHGGGYGITKTHFNTDYELEVCDKYLSYGWSNSNKKILKFGNIHDLDKIKYFFSNKKKSLIFISCKRHKYCTFINSSALWSIDFIETVKFISKFLFNLPKNIKDNMLIRGLPNTDLKKLDFFGTLIKNFKVDNKGDIFDLYKNAKIIVHSTNSTSILETMYLNIPTIIILDKKVPFSKISKNIFLDLKKNNIFFDDPKRASKFIEKIWENGIHSWWNSNNVQRAVKKFNLTFSKRRINVLSDLQKILVNK